MTNTPAAPTRADLSGRHKAEWADFRKVNLDPALEQGDFETARSVKTLADAIRITQDGERKAWEFGEGLPVDALDDDDFQNKKGNLEWVGPNGENIQS